MGGAGVDGIDSGVCSDLKQCPQGQAGTQQPEGQMQPEEGQAQQGLQQEETQGQAQQGRSEDQTKKQAKRKPAQGEDQNQAADADQSGNDEDQAQAGKPKNNADEPATTGAIKAPAEITTEQRTEIRTVVKEVHVEPVTHIDFEINIGVAVPRTVVLHPLPRRIVEIVPAYEGYEFFILADGTIVIVEPSTFKIVYVIA